ncbi:MULTISPECIES: glutamine synthetase family protein [unclassified Oceanobacter]|uniref:glutamine synthetase family protein n=1 Tax=unclassified Oceanobacter TaxID=2620260 RepID=UPI0027350B75|nr:MULTISPECIES: glutamine synthetase family protein [unclassified Oceanobacter]MDP2546977.1 glutamine synthetase family protein [Oceanobacter sp. 4_MG-2023]MDP2607801.1 glutamine synthetase family protein [Oceanobacter sp. 1_MG-2023]MDP2611015.1 glutamine synthetase family protein [Oceanobacter sp. 2_MG-2023]
MEAVERFLKENGITEVESTFPDMTGNARGKFYPTRKFLTENGGHIPECLLVQTVNGEWADNHYDLVDPADKDMLLVPDPSTLRIVPWADEPTALVINDCYTSDGKHHPLSSRSVLRRVLALYEKEGWRPIIAPEVEFYLVQKNSDPDYELKPAMGRSGRRENARQSYSIDAVNEFNPVIDTLYAYCDELGLDVDTLIHESGAAQMEINFLHGDAMSLADQVYIFKRALREAALKHDMYATFMAKPMQSEPGSSMHIHQSLLDANTGKNIFAGEGDELFSATFYHYVGGLQKFTPAAIPFYAPNVNSYRRFVPEIAAPVNFKWGIDNRTAGLRAPKAPKDATRIENRFAGSDCNPYLAIAASLACGYLGMKLGIKAEAPVEALAAHEGDLVAVSRTLEEALRLLEECPELQEVIGEHFVKGYIGVKRAEFETFNKVISSWEREFLLMTV